MCRDSPKRPILVSLRSLSKIFLLLLFFSLLSMKRQVAVLDLHCGQVDGRKSHLWNSSLQFSKVETWGWAWGRRVVFVNWMYWSLYHLDKEGPHHSFMKKTELISFISTWWEGKRQKGQVENMTLSHWYEKENFPRSTLRQCHRLPKGPCAVPILGACKIWQEKSPSREDLRIWHTWAQSWACLKMAGSGQCWGLF